jgi:hypothetical protein
MCSDPEFEEISALTPNLINVALERAEAMRPGPRARFSFVLAQLYQEGK